MTRAGGQGARGKSRMRAHFANSVVADQSCTQMRSSLRKPPKSMFKVRFIRHQQLELCQQRERGGAVSFIPHSRDLDLHTPTFAHAMNPKVERVISVKL